MSVKKEPSGNNSFNPIEIMWNLVNLISGKSSDSATTLMHQECLITFSLMSLDKGLDKAQLPFDFSAEVLDYIQTLNNKAIKLFAKSSDDEEGQLAIIKAVNIFENKEIVKYVDEPTNYYTLKSLTYNNLTNIYQKKKKLKNARKAIKINIRIEEKLM